MVNHNTLKAYNLESGKLAWELGGKFDQTDLQKQLLPRHALALGRQALRP